MCDLHETVQTFCVEDVPARHRLRLAAVFEIIQAAIAQNIVLIGNRGSNNIVTAFHHVDLKDLSFTQLPREPKSYDEAHI